MRYHLILLVKINYNISLTNFWRKELKMRIYFSKYDWGKSCYKPRFQKYWGSKLWCFSIYKFGITLDFRKDSNEHRIYRI